MKKFNLMTEKQMSRKDGGFLGFISPVITNDPFYVEPDNDGK